MLSRIAASGSPRPILCASGLIIGAAVGGFLGIFLLIGAATGWKYAFTLSSLLFCLCVGAFAGVSMMGIGYFERWRQRHYGHYPHAVQDEPGSHT